MWSGFFSVALGGSHSALPMSLGILIPGVVALGIWLLGKYSF